MAAVNNVNNNMEISDNINMDVDLEKALSRIKQLEDEKRRQNDEFCLQRKRLVELMTQKEESYERLNEERASLSGQLDAMKHELDEAKTQLLVEKLRMESNIEAESRKAQEEMASLQLIQSLISDRDSDIEKLRSENHCLRAQTGETSDVRLAPSDVLNAVTKSIAKKLRVDTHDAETLEDRMRYALEDSEHMNSLVQSLQDENAALKDKLRSADAQLQLCKCASEKGTASTILDSSQISHNSDMSSNDTCDACRNYEMHLVDEQTRVKQLEDKLDAVSKANERQKEDLVKQIESGRTMQQKWNEMLEEYKSKVNDLRSKVESAQTVSNDVTRAFEARYSEVQLALGRMEQQQKLAALHVAQVNQENDRLRGAFSKHSSELSNEDINLPNTVEELQVSVLQLQEDLIVNLIKNEILEKNNASLTEQLNEQQLAKATIESLQSELQDLPRLKTDLEECNAERQNVEKQNVELRTQLVMLQQEMDNVEKTEQDFVLLSQKLQMEIEKIRSNKTEVRWQFEEDVNTCSGCKQEFNAMREKVHCRHCGQIFCHECLSNTAYCGPKRRKVKVCDVCHTLLNQNTVPFYSDKKNNTAD